MARLKSTLIMTDTFGAGAQPQRITKTKSHARTRAPKATALTINTCDYTTPATRAQTEHNLPIGWALLGLGVACAGFWSAVAMVILGYF